MVVKSKISETLEKMDSHYQIAILSANPNDATYYAKLAVLEYCGWIEETLDVIAKRCIKDQLKTTEFKQIFEYGVIGGTHGFQYKKHFRSMLIKTIGIVKSEKLHMYLDKNGSLYSFVNELEAVKKDRDDAAHTWIEGTTKTYPAPSIMKGRLTILYPILRDIYSVIVQKKL